jgi:hypothetical protein
MSNEEMQKKMDFIVEQQAQFVVDIHELHVAHGEMTTKHNHLTEAMTAVVGWIGKLAQGQSELTEAQKRTDAQIAETNAQVAETHERLNIFINVVERFINEHRNGRTPSGNEEPEAPK